MDAKKAKKNCPLCGGTISFGDRSCKYCGRSLDDVEGTPAFLGYSMQAAKQPSASPEGGKTGEPRIANGMRSILQARKGTVAQGAMPKADADSGFRFSAAGAGEGLAVCGFIGANPAELIIPSQHGGRPVVEIGPEAFAGLPVAVAVIPPSVQRISDAAFKNCANLFEIKGAAGVGMVGKEAFTGCCMLSRFPALKNPGICASYSSFSGCYRLGLQAEGNCTMV